MNDLTANAPAIKAQVQSTTIQLSQETVSLKTAIEIKRKLGEGFAAELKNSP